LFSVHLYPVKVGELSRALQVEDPCYIVKPIGTTMKKASKNVIEICNFVGCACMLNDASYLLVLFGVRVKSEVSSSVYNFPRVSRGGW
jgi:hypothetical protein